MSDQLKEEILVSVKIDRGKSEEDVVSLTNKISVLTAETKDLQAINKTLAAEGKVLSSQYTENTKTIEANKIAIKESTAERTSLVKGMLLEDNSIGALTAKNKELIKERDKLNTSTQEGRSRLLEINAELSKNKDALTAAKEATDKSTLSWKSFKDGADKVIPGLGGILTGIESGTKAAWAFVATPIGAVLAAVGAALSTVITYFKSSGDGADKLSFIMSAAGATFNEVKDIIIGMGRAIVGAFESPKKAAADLWEFLKDQFVNRITGVFELIPKLGQSLAAVFRGDFTAAATIATDAVGKVVLGVANLTDKITTVTDRIAKETAEAYNLAKALDALEDRERNYNLTASKTILEIQRLTLAARNRNLTTEESTKLLDQAAELEKAKAAELTAIRIGQLDQTTKEVAARLDLDRMKGESLDAFAARLINFSGTQGELTDADKDKIIAAVVAVDQARGESLNVLEKIKNREDAIYLKSLATQQAADAKAAKDRADLLKIQQDNEKAYWDAKAKEAAEHNAQVDADAIAEFETNKKYKQMTADAELKVLSLITKEKSAARLVGNALLKQDTIATIKTQTIKAANSAFAALASIPIVGPVLGAIAYAAVIAKGALDVASVVGVNFARGGLVKQYAQGGGAWTTIGGKSHEQGGTDFWGSDGTRFNAQSDEGIFILKREAHADFIQEQSMRNQKFGGRSWTGQGVQHAALGGSILSMQQSVQADIDQQTILNSFIAAVQQLPAPRVAVDDINAGQANVEVTTSKGTML